MGAMIIYHLSSTAVEDINLNAKLLGKGISGQVELFLSEPQSVLTNISNMIEDVGIADVKTIQDIFDHHISKSKVFDSIYLLDQDSRVISVGLHSGKESFRQDFIGINLAHKEFINRARVTKQNVWSPTFLSLISGKMSMTLCHPIGEYVLAADINIMLLSEMIHQLNMEQISVTVLDNKGAVIIHPDLDVVASQIMMRDIPIVKAALEGNEDIGRFTSLDGEEYIGSAYIVQASNWITLIARPVSQVYHAIYTTFLYLFLGIIGSLIFIFFFAVYRARRLARPLIELSGHTRDIAEGNYELSFIPRAEYTEISELGDSVKRMSEAIREREKLLIENEQQFREVIEGTDNLIFRTDPRGNLTFLNHAGEKVFGLSANELADSSCFDSIHPDEQENIRRTFFQLQYENKETAFFECRLIDPDGNAHSLLWNINFHYDEDGSLTETSSVATDISERLNAEEEKNKFKEQLRQTQKMESIGTMAGGIAHDFNNILSAIMGYLELAKMQIEPGDPVNNDLEEVFKASLRAKDLVQQILTFSRRTKVEKKPIKLNLMIKEGIKLLRASIPTTIEIQQQIPSQCPNVIADPTQIHQIVMNLCTNAYHAMRDSGGIIKVSLEEVAISPDDSLMEHSLRPGPYLLLKISDTGKGIPAEVLPKIFEPYFTTKEVNEGTGLGLSVVHGIVKSHHGHISAQSEVGKGTTFNIYLPAEGAEENVTYQDIDNVLTGGGERLIFVDDEMSLVKISSKLLRNMGYEVSAFTNSPDALQAFREEPDSYDLIITDMTMPVMTGARLAQEAKQIRPDIPIILCSGFTEGLDEKTAGEMGICAYLTKPVLQNDLANTIRKALESVPDKDS
jgi:PAS domain S-box-containing protein